MHTYIETYSSVFWMSTCRQKVPRSLTSLIVWLMQKYVLKILFLTHSPLIPLNEYFPPEVNPFEGI